jgi:NADPH-dependent curcumin reductase CurA
MRQPATPPGSGPQAKVLDMSVPSHADVIVLHRRPGPALLRGELALERRPLPPPGAGEVVVRNVVTSVDPYQLRLLRGSPEVTPAGLGEPVPANSVGIVMASEDPGVPVGRGSPYIGRRVVRISEGRPRSDPRRVRRLGGRYRGRE